MAPTKPSNRRTAPGPARPRVAPKVPSHQREKSTTSISTASSSPPSPAPAPASSPAPSSNSTTPSITVLNTAKVRKPTATSPTPRRTVEAYLEALPAAHNPVVCDPASQNACVECWRAALAAGRGFHASSRCRSEAQGFSPKFLLVDFLHLNMFTPVIDVSHSWPAELLKAKEWHLAATLTWQAIIAWRLDVNYEVMKKEDLPRLASELSQILASYPGPIKKGWRKWTAMRPLAGPGENREKAAVKTAVWVAVQLTEMGFREELLALVGSLKLLGPGLIEEMEGWLVDLRV